MIGLNSSAELALPHGFLQQFEWQSDDPLQGGLSAIDLSQAGQKIVLLSDQGAFSTGEIARDSEGAITNITLAPFQKLKALGQEPLAQGRNDSEGLAIDAAGTAFVSLEGVARVLRYDALAGPAQNLPDHPDFAQMQLNSSLEALAIDASGVLYALPERSGDAAQPFVIYRFQNGVWDAKLSLPRGDDYLPVAADFGPDGKLYILLRQFNGLAGFSSKLIRTTVGQDAIGQIEVLFTSKTGFHDNLEGVSIWRDTQGRLRATMVADDNFLPFLSSGIVEYRLPD